MIILPWFMAFPGGSAVKNAPANAGGTGLIPESGRSPGGGNGSPLQYSCLENPHGQRSLAGYSPRGRKESDRIGQLSVQAPWFLSLFLKVSTVGKQFCAPALGLVALCLLLAAEAFAVNHWSHILESSQEKFQESAWGNSALGARVARWLHLFLCHSLKFQICGKPPLKKTKTLPFFFLFPDCKNCVFVLKKKKQLNIKKCLI